MNATSSDPALLVGLDVPDDAAVYRLREDLALVQTVDFFTPIVDDPWAWGRIAAANALSDVYAMGGRPLTALNLVAWPRALDLELLGRVLEGSLDACEEAGVAVVGGHSVDDPEPKFGLAVTGTVHPDRVVRKTGAGPGAELVLTKPLGMGIISAAVKDGSAGPEAEAEAVAIMSRLNAHACEAMLEARVRSATDVTGFGLMGHLLQMLDRDLDAEVSASAVPLVTGAKELAGRGVLPGGSRRNFEAGKERVDADGVDESLRAVLFDAQTSGGLLMAVDPSRTAELLDS
nr:selenide, water dikinase SelD [Actinomycetota bacterium]